MRTGFAADGPAGSPSPAIALIAFSIYTLGVTTREDMPGDPYFYVIRQASTR